MPGSAGAGSDAAARASPAAPPVRRSTLRSALLYSTPPGLVLPRRPGGPELSGPSRLPPRQVTVSGAERRGARPLPPRFASPAASPRSAGARLPPAGRGRRSGRPSWFSIAAREGGAAGKGGTAQPGGRGRRGEPAGALGGRGARVPPGAVPERGQSPAAGRCSGAGARGRAASPPQPLGRPARGEVPSAEPAPGPAAGSPAWAAAAGPGPRAARGCGAGAGGSARGRRAAAPREVSWMPRAALASGGEESCLPVAVWGGRRRFRIKGIPFLDTPPPPPPRQILHAESVVCAGRIARMARSLRSQLRLKRDRLLAVVPSGGWNVEQVKSLEMQVKSLPVLGWKPRNLWDLSEFLLLKPHIILSRREEQLMLEFERTAELCETDLRTQYWSPVCLPYVFAVWVPKLDLVPSQKNPKPTKQHSPRFSILFCINPSLILCSRLFSTYLNNTWRNPAGYFHSWKTRSAFLCGNWLSPKFYRVSQNIQWHGISRSFCLCFKY